ncbi:MAG: GNAT family N-acetyltransferase [Nocardioides sp.]
MPDGGADPDLRTTLLAAYDAQLRGDAEVQGSVSWERSGPLWRGLFTDSGFVSYESLESLGSIEAVDALIGETVAHFAAVPEVEEFEWKTRGHDWPAELDQHLRAHGLEPDEVETVMVGEASSLAVDVDLPDGLSVRRVDDLPEPERETVIREASTMQHDVFGAGPTGDQVLDRLERMQGAETFWVAEAGGRVVSAGRLNRVAGTEFAGLWGGATLPEWRGKGIYRALTAARARFALAEGVRFMHSDCSAMSRPILERSGLVAVTTTTPYVWKRDRAS